jgi:hypothetical protein
MSQFQKRARRPSLRIKNGSSRASSSGVTKSHTSQSRASRNILPSRRRRWSTLPLERALRSSRTLMSSSHRKYGRLSLSARLVVKGRKTKQTLARRAAAPKAAEEYMPTSGLRWTDDFHSDSFSELCASRPGSLRRASRTSSRTCPRSSMLNPSTPNAMTGKLLVLPLPGAQRLRSLVGVPSCPPGDTSFLAVG